MSRAALSLSEEQARFADFASQLDNSVESCASMSISPMLFSTRHSGQVRRLCSSPPTSRPTRPRFRLSTATDARATSNIAKTSCSKNAGRLWRDALAIWRSGSAARRPWFPRKVFIPMANNVNSFPGAGGGSGRVRSCVSGAGVRPFVPGAGASDDARPTVSKGEAPPAGVFPRPASIR